MSKNTACPDLDQIIQQITNNEDFKHMMESVSDELTDTGTLPGPPTSSAPSAPSAPSTPSAPSAPSATLAPPSDSDTHRVVEVDATDSPNHEEPMSHYDMLCTFFSDSDGNSISDTLVDIHSALDRIATSLEVLVKKDNSQ